MAENSTFIIRSRAVFDGLGKAPKPAAILVSGERIEKILAWDYVREEKGLSQVKLYDYGSRLIMPAFVDAHTHLFSAAIVASEHVCDTLGEGTSQADCVEILKQYAAQHPGQTRIRGTGWFVGNWEDRTLPDKRSLDAAFPDTPVYLQCADCHSFWLNSAALAEAGITPRPDMDSGVVCTWEDGELTGLLLEPAAYEPANEKYLDFSDEQMADILKNFMQILAESGICAASEMFADDYTEETLHQYGMLKQMDEAGELTANIYLYPRLFGYTDFSPYFDMKGKIDSAHVMLNGVKGFVDGVTETHTGLLLEPYEDQPDSCGDGLPLCPQEQMQESITAANKSGLQVRLHCIADGSVRMALDMYEQSQEINGDDSFRNTVEHIENINADDIDRFAKLNVIPSIQPYHLTLANHSKHIQLGQERCKLEWATRSILAAGGRVAFGTDCPVVGIDPFQTIYAAVTRKDDAGVPVSHNPWEVIDMATALQCYTLGAARAYKKEAEFGSLEAGKKANLIVLDRNLFEIPENEIEQTRVAVNYFEGEPIYCRAQ